MQEGPKPFVQGQPTVDGARLAGACDAVQAQPELPKKAETARKLATSPPPIVVDGCQISSAVGVAASRRARDAGGRVGGRVSCAGPAGHGQIGRGGHTVNRDSARRGLEQPIEASVLACPRALRFAGISDGRPVQQRDRIAIEQLGQPFPDVHHRRPTDSPGLARPVRSVRGRAASPGDRAHGGSGAAARARSSGPPRVELRIRASSPSRSSGLGGLLMIGVRIRPARTHQRVEQDVSAPTAARTRPASASWVHRRRRRPASRVEDDRALRPVRDRSEVCSRARRVQSVPRPEDPGEW